MKKHVSIALVMALALCVSVTYEVGNCDAVETVNIGRTFNYYYFVGFSNSLVTGNLGLRGMNKACESKYGQGARMCTSHDIQNSWKIPLVSGFGWVNPSNIQILQLQDGFEYAWDTVSGVRYGASHNAQNLLNCDQWTREEVTSLGLAWDATVGGVGAFKLHVCSETGKVACCNR